MHERDRETRARAALRRRLVPRLEQLATVIERSRLGVTDGASEAVAFLRSLRAPEPDPVDFAEAEPTPLDLLRARAGLAAEEIDLLVLAGMPDEHECFASVLRTLHPRGESRANVGLAFLLLAPDEPERLALRRTLECGAAVRLGFLRLEGDGPWVEKSLVLAEALWPVLNGRDVWPEGLQPLAVTAAPERVGAHDEAATALRALHDRVPCTILVQARTETTAIERVAGWARAAGTDFRAFRVPAASAAALAPLLQVHTLARDVVAVMALGSDGGGGEAPGFADHPDTLVIGVREGTVQMPGPRPLLAIALDPIGPLEGAAHWARAIPELAAWATDYAARWRLEPFEIGRVATDARLHAACARRAVDTADVERSVRQRADTAWSSGVRVLRPRAGWSDLVLPPAIESRLRELVDRVRHQPRVLGEWGFLRGRRGARGVKALFAGAPGTGKTLAAEVVAGVLGMDLVIVDLSRVLSKWIGETERNLAAVFDEVERSQAAVLFDEAEALYGRRTEITHAQDKWANLETAYLLSRLESFDGLAILSTNLRHQIDPAFLRRLEFIVDFPEPQSHEREALWRLHVPPAAPVGADVDFRELAQRFPLAGGWIRNASVAAAFLAAADGGRITRRHLVHATRREYEKSGKAYPGDPADGAEPRAGDS